MVDLVNAFVEDLDSVEECETTNWSPYQIAFFDWLRDGDGSCILNAVAGSGKTTTGVHSLSLLPSEAKVIFLAFNKAIAVELNDRTRHLENVIASTFHSLGFKAWTRAHGRTKVDGSKTRWLMKDNYSKDEFWIYGSFVTKLVGHAKNAGVGILLALDNNDVWEEMIYHHDLTLSSSNEDASIDRAIEIAREVLALSISDRRRFDFDDMLYMPLHENVPFDTFDYVFGDEMQDTNGVQRAIIQKILEPKTGRLIAIGDPHQAIYGFRGADSSAMERIREEFNCTELPLSVCYRCGSRIVQEAQAQVPHIETFDGAPIGTVRSASLGKDIDLSTFTKTDAIICRLNAPLIKFAYSLIKEGRPCKVLGKAIGDGLVSLVKQMKAKDVNDLESKLWEYQAREMEKHIARGREDKAQALEDRLSCLAIFVESNRTIDALIESIQSMFDDNTRGSTTLCTIHKAKGMEWDRVFILDRFALMPSKWARKDWQQEQESNLIYVAVTRAKEELVYLSTTEDV